MNKEELNKLRTKIIDALEPIMMDESLSPEDKFEYYLTIGEATGQIEAINKALDFANKIEDKTMKANSLMSLLDLVSEMSENK